MILIPNHNMNSRYLFPELDDLLTEHKNEMSNMWLILMTALRGNSTVLKNPQRYKIFLKIAITFELIR